jgi:rubrerythrin
LNRSPQRRIATWNPKGRSTWKTQKKKAQDAIDHAREVREQKIADRAKSGAEPRLIADGKLQRCSVCGYPFQPDEKPSVSVAFADHLLKAHQPA